MRGSLQSIEKNVLTPLPIKMSRGIFLAKTFLICDFLFKMSPIKFFTPFCIQIFYVELHYINFNLWLFLFLLKRKKFLKHSFSLTWTKYSWKETRGNCKWHLINFSPFKKKLDIYVKKKTYLFYIYIYNNWWEKN